MACAAGFYKAQDSSLVAVMAHQENGNKLSKGLVATTMKAGPGRSLQKMKAVLVKGRYRKDLTKAALRRAAAISRSQKALPARKGAKAPAAKKE